MNTNNSTYYAEEEQLFSLRDGTLVDPATKEGLTAMLKECPRFDWFSSALKTIRELLKKKRLSESDSQQLQFYYDYYFNRVAKKVDKETFRAKVPESEIQEWINFAIQEIKGFTEKRYWISTGSLNDNDFKVLEVCENMFTYGHVLPVCLAFESDFFQVLADFIKVRKGHGRRALMPNVTICASIGKIVCSTLLSANHHFDNCWSLEKIFKKFAKRGILEQFLRCSTVPLPASSGQGFCWESQDPMHLVLEKLAGCPGILTQKFKHGEPCHDTLQAILNGQDGSRDIPPGIFNRLQGICRLVEIMVDVCYYCLTRKGNSEAPLQVCGGCQIARYCSKECQKAHWKMHKDSCQKVTKPEMDREVTCCLLMAKFKHQSLESVFHAIDEKCSSAGVEAGDLAVEVDLMPKNTDGIIPAFHDPPTFRIVLTRDYISGQDVPEWILRAKSPDVSNLWRAWIKEEVKEDLTEGISTSASLVMHHAGNEYIERNFF